MANAGRVADPEAAVYFVAITKASGTNMAQPVSASPSITNRAGGWSKFPWYAIRENYCNAVRRAGGLPILLPHDPGAAAAYLGRIDGLS